MEDRLPELDDLAVPSGERPLGGEPVPDAPEELVALLDGLGVLDRGPGVGRAEGGEQAVEELPPVGGGSFHDPDVVREEGHGPYPRAAGGVVGEGRWRGIVYGEALFLTRGVADGHFTLHLIEGYAGLRAGKILSPADDLGVVRGARGGAGDGEGDRLEQVRLPLGVVPDDNVQAGGEEDGVVGVVAEVDEPQRAEVGGQWISNRSSSPTSTTSPFCSLRPRRVSTSPFTRTTPPWIRTFASPPLPTRFDALSAWPSVMPEDGCKGAAAILAPGGVAHRHDQVQKVRLFPVRARHYQAGLEGLVELEDHLLRVYRRDAVKEISRVEGDEELVLTRRLQALVGLPDLPVAHDDLDRPLGERQAHRDRRRLAP